MFQIVRKFLPIDKSAGDLARAEIVQVEGDTIFNGGMNMDTAMHDAIGDGKRRQIPIERSAWSQQGKTQRSDSRCSSARSVFNPFYSPCGS